MKIIADMHTHTLASGHAYSTLNELALEAARKGLLAIAMTDHGPSLPGGPHPFHFGALRFIPRYLHGVRIFTGIEANILDARGTIDLPTNHSHIEFIMAGFHEDCGFAGAGEKANTSALLAVMKNPQVKAISHPGNPAFPIDMKEIVRAATATGTALEINDSSFHHSRTGSKPYCEKLASLAAEAGAPIIVGSDAHIAQGVGCFCHALEVIQHAGISADQIVNTSLERLLSFLGLLE
jgi:putative hydrolase